MKNLTAPCTDSKTFCILPWIHLNVMPDSSVIPCCVSPYDDVYGDGAKQSLMEIWNSEKFKLLRKNMLSEIPSNGCSRCYNLEASGFKSMRQEMNTFFNEDFPLVEQTQADGTVLNITLNYIDIRFSNLCNFKCRGCGPALSSAWYDDHQLLYNYKSENSKLRSLTVNSPSFWNELKALIPKADVIYFGGGEPLITKEHFEILENLNSLKLHHIELRYNTNLSQLNFGDYNLSDLWVNFKNVTLSISIDDIGPRAEYFRHGTKWPQIQKNLDTLINNYPQINRFVNFTVNMLNVFYIPEIIDFLISRQVIKPYQFHFNLLLDPDELRIDAIPEKLKKRITNKLKKYKFKISLINDSYNGIFNEITKILDFMNATDNSSYLSKFKTNTLKLDQLRSESFSKTYPELTELIEVINV